MAKASQATLSALRRRLEVKELELAALVGERQKIDEDITTCNDDIAALQRAIDLIEKETQP